LQLEAVKISKCSSETVLNCSFGQFPRLFQNFHFDYEFKMLQKTPLKTNPGKFIHGIAHVNKLLYKIVEIMKFDIV
jgi:hypothetical protein